MANTNAAKKSVENMEEPVQMQVVKNEIPEEKVVHEVAPVIDIPKEPELTLEQKITKVEDLSMLIDKWRKLQESYRNLQTFNLTTDGMSHQILLRDINTGREFKTSNSAVVTRIIEEIRSTLLGKISEVESQIRF
jgi:hypothetical protein